MTFDIYMGKDTTVTEKYVGIIEQAVASLNCQTNHIDKIKFSRQNKNRAVIILGAIEALKASMAGYGKIVLWVQGIIPDESYMRNHSKLRVMVLSSIEKRALRKADFVFMVSNEMKNHLENKYNIKIDKYYIMPCFNDEISEASFKDHDYKANRFVYAGGFSAWQCFGETLDLYKGVEDKYGDAVSLRVLTREREAAESMIKSRGIRHYSVSHVPKEDVALELQKCKFGFCIREDDVVNRVATPTKLSSYVGNGVVPIFTHAIRDFSNVAKDSKYCLCIDDNGFYDQLDCLIRNEIDWNDIYQDFASHFGEYYSSEHYLRMEEGGIPYSIKGLLDEEG